MYLKRLFFPQNWRLKKGNIKTPELKASGSCVWAQIEDTDVEGSIETCDRERVGGDVVEKMRPQFYEDPTARQSKKLKIDLATYW